MMQATTMVSVKYEQGWVTGLRTVRDAGCWMRLALVFGAFAILLDPAFAAPSGVLDPGILPMRVAVVGDRDGGWNVALEELGWKTVRHASDDAGWKRADESLDGVDVLLIPALDRPALRTVHLVGDRPSFGSNLFAGVPAYRVRIFVPLGNASWDAALGNNFSGVANVTACADPSPAELATYRETYPGERRPKKVITFNGSNKQYLVIGGDPAGVILVR